MAHIQENFQCAEYILSSIFRKKVCLQQTFESVKIQFWVMNTVEQQIPSQRAHNNKVLMTETVQSIASHD